MDKKRRPAVASITLERAGGAPPGKKRRRLWLTLAALLLALALAALLLWGGYRKYMRSAYPVKYEELVTRYAQEYGFEPSFLYAVIRTESSFNPDAVSSADAIGLMQITEVTFDWAQMRSPEDEALPVNELFDPETNIRYGAMVLSLLREIYPDTTTFLAAYNAGIGNVRRWLEDPAYSDDGETLKAIPYSETAQYVERIPAAQKMYRELYPDIDRLPSQTDDAHSGTTGGT